MAFLKFNKAELVNLEYSLKREILDSNKAGAYFNTSIIACNTRKYHGLLVVPQGDRKSVLLSALDESVVFNSRQFNLGIQCYGDIYDPKGHKYIVDFNADGVPTLTYKVGPVVLAKSIVMAPDRNQVLIRYSLESAPGKVRILYKPFLAYRDIHALTMENPAADTGYEEVDNGVRYCMYPGMPSLYLQSSVKPVYRHQPYWYKGVTYSDEYRRGYDCREDLLVPGSLSLEMKEGDSVVISVSTECENPRSIKAQYARICSSFSNIGSHRDILLRNADRLKVVVDGKKKICAGYSWLKAGLLRESIISLPGLTLYANGSKAEFEEILDNLIAAESERLFHRTTQIEAPLMLTDAIQQYIDFGADPKAVWKKYGNTLKEVIESYTRREEASISPNGLLWCQKDRTALTWMNTYVNGWPVNERAGFQVEVNAMWYNALCFALEMEGSFGPRKGAFISKWAPIRDLVKESFQKVFLISGQRGYYTLADYVDNAGQHGECRPNMLWAIYIRYPLLSEQIQLDVLNSIKNDLVTRRGIRTLSPRSENYRSVYDGTQIERDYAYHNGCTFAMLLGPYEDYCFRMVGSNFSHRAKWLTEGFFEDVNVHGVGSFSELYDADPPHEPHGAVSCASSTAALLRCLYLMDKYSKEENK